MTTNDTLGAPTTPPLQGWSRLYDVCGKDGYPLEWHETIKHAVREDAGHRCVRCLHPYTKGEGEWSRCDTRCAHEGPVRTRPTVFHDWIEWKHMPPVTAPTQVEARYRILTVHHLDGNKLNCRWWNLAALCQRCHLTIQGKVQMERVYPWPHTEWFRPYVAGYYAWVYLGQEITREEAADRLDELLGLERAA